jgi:hypothetical protein
LSGVQDDFRRMADGEITVKLDAEIARRVRAVAEAAGRSVDSFVADLVADRLAPERSAEAAEALEEYARTGQSSDAETEMAAFRRRVANRVTKG